MSLKETYKNEIYYRYLSIEDKAYSEKIKFVNNYSEIIEAFNPLIKLEIMYNYGLALQEVKRHNTVINLTQELLEFVIDQNIYRVGELDIYNELLRLKGTAYKAQGNLLQANHIFQELYKIDNSTDNAKSLTGVQFLIRHDENQLVRAGCIALFLFSGLLIAIELFLIRPFYYDYVGIIEFSRNFSFILGLALYIGSNFNNHLRNRKMLKKLK